SGFSDSVKYFLAESTHSQDCSASLKLNRYSYNLESGHTGIDLDIITEGFSDQYDKTIDWGDVAISHQTSELNSERLHHVYPGIGHYNGHVSVSDKLCGLTVYFTVNIYSGKPAPWRLITIIVLIIISLNLAHRTIVKLKRPV
ncbi:hypothetical protein KC878_01620, partial [Candidatus Saccharibacteria bacterium]|nr:hypothetical protein [Candidatus Saccharibacteria bacterium]